MLFDLQEGFFVARGNILAVVPAVDWIDFSQKGAEFCGLLAAADWSELSVMKVHEPDPKSPTLLRSGTLSEIRRMHADIAYDAVVIDCEASPTQQKNLQNALDVPVFDRTGLILAIFGRRAFSHEGKLQVELAQAQYALPRLTKMWGHLGRIVGSGGTAGTRGKGEKQIEMDRRYLRRRIVDIQKRLTRVSDHRQRISDSRRSSGLSQVSLVGYTNAGKSSLLEVLAKTDGLSEDALFATLEAKIRRVNRHAGGGYLVADTVGFIDRLATELVDAFHATLEIAVTADLIIVVVDASDPSWKNHLEVADVTLERIGANEVPRLYCMNKIDLVTEPDQFLEYTEGGGYEMVFVSAVDHSGLEDLHQAILRNLSLQRVLVRFRIEAADGATRSRFYEESLLTDEKWDGEECILTGYLREKDAQKYLEH